MNRGDSLAEPRAAEVVDLGLDLGLDDPRQVAPPPGMRSRRAAARERRLRRVLTVGALAFAAWAVVLWSTRHSVTVGDRAALAATGETAAAPAAAPPRAPRPIDPNAPGAAFAAAPAVPAPAPVPAAAPAPVAEKSPSTAHGQARSRSGAGTAPAGASKQHHRRGRR